MKPNLVEYAVRMRFVEYEGGFHKVINDKTFDNEGDAWDFYADVKLNLNNMGWCIKLGDKYCGNGYVCDLIGLFKIEETRMDE
jgi:hypothetical protein